MSHRHIYINRLGHELNDFLTNNPLTPEYKSIEIECKRERERQERYGTLKWTYGHE